MIPLRAAQPHGPQRQEAGSGTVIVPIPPVNASARIATPGDSGTQRRVTLVTGANEDRALVPYQSEPGESRYSPSLEPVTGFKFGGYGSTTSSPLAGAASDGYPINFYSFKIS